MGIPENENVYKVAKRALNPLIHEFPFADVKHLMQRFIIKKKWQETWDIE